MCGIVGYIGHDACYKYLLNSLIRLQNRGYDSAGICSIDKTKNKIEITKYASCCIPALDKLSDNNNILKHKQNTIGIGHTRWATHGAKIDVNAHPHLSINKKFAVVHNGIIENYSILKLYLEDNGYNFESQTDTEVISNLLEFEYNKQNNHNDKQKHIILSIKKTISQLQGTWSLVILCIDDNSSLYCTRHGSPLLIAINNDYAMISSEQYGFDEKIKDYTILKNCDVCALSIINNKIEFITEEKYKFVKTIDNIKLYLEKKYQHWTLQEIYEQPESCIRAICMGSRILSDTKVMLGGLNSFYDKLIKINNIILLGCGTSYYAAQIGAFYFKNICNLNTIQAIDGGEFTSNDIPKIGKTCLILISQSGETKDLYRCLEIGKKYNLFLMGIVNVVDSMIAREVDCGCYLNAGKEIAVASTKSFTSQIILLSMIAIWFAQSHNINIVQREEYISDLKKLRLDIKKVLKIVEQKCDKIISILDYHSCLILGKGVLEPVAYEGALKFKEMSYTHAEGFSSSTLKHGPFALLDNNIPIILLAPVDDNYQKSINTYEEIKSRVEKLLIITDNNKFEYNNTIIIPTNKTFTNILCAIPLQLLAYKLAVYKKINPDYPKNLAKTVTVD